MAVGVTGDADDPAGMGRFMKKSELEVGMLARHFSATTGQVESVVILVIDDECLHRNQVIVLRRGTRDVVSNWLLGPL